MSAPKVFDKMFAELDANGDNKVSYREVKAYAKKSNADTFDETVKQVVNPIARGAANLLNLSASKQEFIETARILADSLDGFDRNGDRFVSAKELKDLKNDCEHGQNILAQIMATR